MSFRNRSRILSLILFLMFVTGYARSQDSSFFSTPWPENVPYPTPLEIEFPQGITHGIIQDCDVDPEYKFLHETAIGELDGSFFAAWYNNLKSELQGKTFQRGRWSRDRGQTWSEPEIVMDEGNDKGRKFVGIQFLNQDGKLYAFSNEEVEGGLEKLVHMLLLVYDTKGQRWKTIAPIAPRFLAMQQPILMKNGNYVIVGSYNPIPGGQNGVIPAIYVSQGKELAKPWKRYLIDTEYINIFAETALIVEGSNMLAVTRLENSPFPKFYLSRNEGKNWTPLENRTFYASSSKFAAGTLSNGVRYIIYNLPEFQKDSEGKVIPKTLNRNRKTLVMATAQPGEDHFSRIWKISDPTTSTQQVASHYPCAVESQGKLYIVYTGQHKNRNCGLSIVPIDSLK